jgi:hypothetical protein
MDRKKGRAQQEANPNAAAIPAAVSSAAPDEGGFAAREDEASDSSIGELLEIDMR